MSKREPIKSNNSAGLAPVAKNEVAFTIEENELSEIQEHSFKTANIVSSILDLNPEIETVVEIITSLIVSPNDMITKVINYNTDAKLPTMLKANFADMLKTYVENTYKLSDKIEDIIEKSLYTRGAYVELNLPRESLNVLSSMGKNNRELGRGLMAGTEDGINAIANAIYNKSTRVNKTNFTEDNIKISDSTELLIMDMIEPSVNVSNHHSAFAKLTAGNEDGVFNLATPKFGNNFKGPIIKEISPDDLIPICTIDNPGKHEGYFYITNNRFKSITNTKDFTNLTEDRLEKMFSTMNDNVKFDSNKVPKIKNIGELKDLLVKNKLKEYLKQTGLNTNVSVELTDRLALALADNIIEESGVNIMYLPPELVSYYAINYRQNGIGKSLIENIAILASVRSILTFADTSGMIKNAIPNTEISIQLDKNTVNYKEIVAKVTKNVMGLNKHKLPIGIFGASNIIKWTQNAGITIKTDYVGVPDTNVTWTETNSNIARIDDSVFDRLDKQIYTALYATKAMLDKTEDSDFAITIRQSSQFLNKRINKLQGKYNKLITSDIKKKLLLDTPFINKVKDLVKGSLKDIKKFIKTNPEAINYTSENDDDLILRVAFELIDKLSISLQKPLDENTKTKNSDFVDFTSTLDSVIKALLSTDTLPSDLTDNLGDGLDKLTAAMKTKFILEYMVENNILPEFTSSFRLNENGEPDLSVIQDYDVFKDTLTKLVDTVKPPEPKITNDDGNTDNTSNSNTDGNSDNSNTDDTSDDNVDDNNNE